MFSPATFKFLRELEANNRRDWFNANKERYLRDARDPMLEFIAAFAPRLKKISARFAADPSPNGGSMFRIYRDTRFSKDKSPYKTYLAAHFQHASCGEEMMAPGFYVSLAPGECYMGVAGVCDEGDTYMGDNTDCTGIPPCPPTGACCHEDGTNFSRGMVICQRKYFSMKSRMRLSPVAS